LDDVTLQRVARLQRVVENYYASQSTRVRPERPSIVIGYILQRVVEDVG